ncbi:MAG: hypothetical protein ACRDWS_08530 [Acidimicrobiia bacterium]
MRPPTIRFGAAKRMYAPRVAEGNPLQSTALTLGVIAIATIGGGAAVILLGDPDQGSTAGGLLIRVGALLGAVALVLPTIRRPSLSTLLLAGAGLILVLARPALVWAALLAWSLWVILGRQRRTSNKES